MGRMLAESKMRRAGAAGLAAAALLCSALVSCRKDDGLVFRGAPIILISVDTLRADHLPAYGYRGVETPSLDALRKDAVLFENAYAHVPLTLPSHAAMFTGLLPPQNGVRDNLGYALSSGPTTLASYLKEKGYETGGAVSSIVLSHVTGVGRGFDFYEDTVEPDRVSQTLSRVQRRGDETTALLSDWIGPPRRPAVSRVSSPLRAPHALRASGALRQPVQAGLRRRDRACRRDRRRISPVPQGPGHLRPRAHRLSFGSRRRAE